MKFYSTKNSNFSLYANEAILEGLAPDGGLFIPDTFTKLDWQNLDLNDPAHFAEQVLAPFFEDDPIKKTLAEHCKKAFSFPLPVVQLKDHTKVLELFHGPTGAFKDVGARFLSSVVASLPNIKKKPRLVLVATSGDTGGAVAAAFNETPSVRVAILYPKGKVSKRQERQLTCWSDNITAIAVDGTFDDCQKLVKDAFQNEQWNKKWQLIAANSISIARLLPQMVYYALTSVNYFYANKKPAEFIIPTGNLGNAVAAFWAREMGFPIQKIGLALNANAAILNYSRSGQWHSEPTKATLANAMDVGSPSNIERLLHLHPDYLAFNKISDVISASDNDIRSTIEEVYKKLNYVICPHTATAFFAKKHFNWRDPIIVATAHPAKFEDIVEPLIKKPVEIPPALQELLELPIQKIEISNNLNELFKAIN